MLYAASGVPVSDLLKHVIFIFCLTGYIVRCLIYLLFYITYVYHRLYIIFIIAHCNLFVKRYLMRLFIKMSDNKCEGNFFLKQLYGLLRRQRFQNYLPLDKAMASASRRSISSIAIYSADKSCPTILSGVSSSPITTLYLWYS